MHEIFNMLLAVFDRAALMLICLFFLIRIRLFRELLHKSAHSPKELLAVTAIFSLFALFSTVRRSRRRLAGERTYYRGDVRRDSVWPVGGHHYRRDCGYSPVFN